MAAFRPTRTVCFMYYDLYPPGKVVSFVKGAVPPLTNSHVFLLVLFCLCDLRCTRLNFYSFLRQPAITRFGRSVTSTRSSSHSFATETGWPLIGCLGVAHLVSGLQTKGLFAWVYWLNHDAKGTRFNLCFLVLIWVISFLFQLSLAVLFLSLCGTFSVSHTQVKKWFSFWC